METPVELDLYIAVLLIEEMCAEGNIFYNSVDHGESLQNCNREAGPSSDADSQTGQSFLCAFQKLLGERLSVSRSKSHGSNPPTRSPLALTGLTTYRNM